MSRLAVALVAILVIAAVGCSKSQPSEETPSAQGSPTSQAANPTATPGVSPTAAPTQQPLATGTPVVIEQEASLLEVLSPEDESVLTESELIVVGLTLPDAVVTVNDVAAEVDENGQFFAAITLEEGPNTIEVIASDFSGNEESAVLTVIYLP